MADERNPSGPDAGNTPADGTQPIPTAEPDETSTFDPFVDDDDDAGVDAADADDEPAEQAKPTTPDATQRVEPQYWAARASVPSDAGTDDGLDHPAPAGYPPAGDPAPDRDGDAQRTWLTPRVIGVVVVVLLAMLGTGLYLIFDSSDDGPRPGPNVTAGASSATPAPSVAAEPTPTAPDTPTQPATVAPTTEAPTPTSVPTTVPPTVSAQVPVPNLIGQTEAAARQQLTERGLVPQVITQFRPGVPEKTVITTEPGPGSMVDRGTKVTVVVAAAPPVSPSPAAAASAASRP